MFFVFVLPHLEFLPFVVGGLVFYIKLLCKTLLASFKLFVCEREFTFWSDSVYLWFNVILPCICFNCPMYFAIH